MAKRGRHERSKAGTSNQKCASRVPGKKLCVRQSRNVVFAPDGSVRRPIAKLTLLLAGATKQQPGRSTRPALVRRRLDSTDVAAPPLLSALTARRHRHSHSLRTALTVRSHSRSHALRTATVHLRLRLRLRTAPVSIATVIAARVSFASASTSRGFPRPLLRGCQPTMTRSMHCEPNTTAHHSTPQHTTVHHSTPQHTTAHHSTPQRGAHRRRCSRLKSDRSISPVAPPSSVPQNTHTVMRCQR